MGKPQREIDPFRDELAALRSALGNRIRELCKAKGWSQEQFSAYPMFIGLLLGRWTWREEPLLPRHRTDCTVLWHHDGELLAGIETGESPHPRRKSGVMLKRRKS